MKIILKILATVLALLLVANYVPGIEVASFYTALIVAVILGVINLIVKPILVILTLPINILTFGLFTFVINALLFWFVATFVDGFSVDWFVPAFLGALILTAFGWVANRLL
ncbi:MAG: phage holin family protein [Parcubacteria group bacterium]|nr:phage holin family protein [Parcubacteria group bacterium]